MAENARRAIKVALFILAAAYPAFVYLALMHWQWDVHYLLVLLIGILGLRLVLDKRQSLGSNLHIVFALIAMIVLGLAFSSDVGLRFYPVLINLAMLYLFALSLFFPPTVIERLARMTEPELPESGVRYTRKLTKVWCLFFVINGGIACYTALFSSYEIWAWYNGFISYLAIGLLFIVEYPIRLYVKNREQRRDASQ